MSKPLRLLYVLWLALAALPAFALEPPPRLSAQAWVLVDYATGNVLAEHNSERRLPPASVTKLMSAYLVFEYLQTGKIGLGDPVLVSHQAANARGSRVPMKAGTYVSLEDLVKAMLIRSANNATVALAEHIAGSEPRFVAEMNLRARAWGLKGTTFINSHGLDVPGHLSTARDLSRIAAALIRDFPDYYRWFSQRDFTFNNKLLHNSNGLLWQDDAVDGMKTGYTRHAGWCLVSSAVHEKTRLIATVLGAPSNRARVAASKRLLDHGFRNFETHLVYAANQAAAEARVWMGESALVPLGFPQNLYLTLPRGMHERLQTRLQVQEMLYAPVQTGQALGKIVLRLDDKLLAEYPLVALKDVRVGGVVEQTIDNLQLWMR